MKYEVKVEIRKIERHFPFWEATSEWVRLIVCGWQSSLLL